MEGFLVAGPVSLRRRGREKDPNAAVGYKSRRMLSPSQRERQRAADLTETPPRLEPELRRWLAEIMELAHPGHRWLPKL
jgi:hypothetical protein